MLTGYKDKKYALIGDVPSHVFSTRLQGMLADYEYTYKKASRRDLAELLADETFDGFNITYPLKDDAVQYLADMSDAARRIGSVNCVVRRDGALYGDNTDYMAFCALLTKNEIDPKGKKVIILGSGATSRAVSSALFDRGADDIVVISRNGEDNYSSLDMHDDAAIIVNTTPVGMAPDFTSSPVSLHYFNSLECVIDVVFEPFRTELMLEAESLGIPTVGGLDMLSANSKAACELFTGRHISELSAQRAASSLEAEMKNIVLVGMPGCGKSEIALELSRALSREVCDTDREVSHAAGLSIPEIYELFGEEAFRQTEEEVIRRVARGAGAVIACGAGAILREDNIKELRRNSTVIFLRREIERLATSGRRITSRDTLMKLYKERIPLYLAASDIIVDVGETKKDTVKSIVKALYKK